MSAYPRHLVEFLVEGGGEEAEARDGEQRLGVPAPLVIVLVITLTNIRIQTVSRLATIQPVWLLAQTSS